MNPRHFPSFLPLARNRNHVFQNRNFVRVKLFYFFCICHYREKNGGRTTTKHDEGSLEVWNMKESYNKRRVAWGYIIKLGDAGSKSPKTIDCMQCQINFRNVKYSTQLVFFLYNQLN